uniref:Androgen-induced protein 1 n=1 Tax=Caligus rogercresseyi TaxID=217165 RepID=C1BR34_CALRO|nr:Androgen-induced protein 1 [Caligus rogercresseyi]|eukprot:TRINITY_DN2116_c0_g1_i1.p1 TRINITY_DN2116_c0_g1~~TRINITY_DN2116_c0_g1_i1.p1  ORF type:complete len:242 (+),score=46.18 TRINITY_DN2116_c0_g1_i1:80-805(+)
MSLKIARLLAHVGSVGNFIFAIDFQWNLEIPLSLAKDRESFGGAWKFMTFWNLWVQLGMSLLCLGDILSEKGLSSEYAKVIRGLRDYYFTSLGFPIGSFVGFMFWGLWWVNRELVMPKALDPFIPSYVNHMLHTTCLFITLFELFSTQHSYVSRARGLITTSLFSAVYLAWVCYIAYAGGFWVYPIMEILPPLQRGLFIAFSILAVDLLYFLGDILNDFVWEDSLPPHIKRFHRKKAQKFE